MTEPAAEHPIEEPLPEEFVEDPRPRRKYPSTIGGALYLGILAATLVGLGLTALDDWRFGMKWLAGALVAAAALRLVMPHREAGMLEVRNRAQDVLLLAGVGVAVFFLAVTIPNQPL